MDKTALYGFLILACCIAVTVSAPKDDSDYQGDDYDYGDQNTDDQSASNQQLGAGRTTNVEGNYLTPYFPNAEESVIGTIGKNILLKCDVQNNKPNYVILWYKGDMLVLTTNLNSKDYKLVNNDMLILNATVNSQGDYYCELQPGFIRKHLHVSVGEQPMEALVPESSTSESGAATIAVSSVLCLAVATLVTLQRR